MTLPQAKSPSWREKAEMGLMMSPLSFSLWFQANPDLLQSSKSALTERPLGISSSCLLFTSAHLLSIFLDGPSCVTQALSSDFLPSAHLKPPSGIQLSQTVISVTFHTDERQSLAQAEEAALKCPQETVLHRKVKYPKWLSQILL